MSLDLKAAVYRAPVRKAREGALTGAGAPRTEGNTQLMIGSATGETRWTHAFNLDAASKVWIQAPNQMRLVVDPKTGFWKGSYLQPGKGDIDPLPGCHPAGGTHRCRHGMGHGRIQGGSSGGDSATRTRISRHSLKHRSTRIRTPRKRGNLPSHSATHCLNRERLRPPGPFADQSPSSDPSLFGWMIF